MQRFLTTATVGLCLAATLAAGEETSRGHLVLNGGGSKPDVVIEKFIELAGCPEARIVVFPTASAEGDTGEYYQRLFADYDCNNVVVAEVHSKADAEDSGLAAVVRKAGGIWFSGGDQRRIARGLLDTVVGDAVGDAFNRGAVVGGTSAGTACQSPLMITGDGDYTVITAANIELWEGFGFFRGVIVDQHHVARRRNNRLISAVLEHPDLVGVGVDEATAVWVRPDGTFEVLGDGWVIVYDATRATINHAPRNRLGRPLGAHGLMTHVLLPGDVFDVGKRLVIDHGHRNHR
jgi:cyanophycinase